MKTRTLTDLIAFTTAEMPLRISRPLALNVSSSNESVGPFLPAACGLTADDMGEAAVRGGWRSECFVSQAQAAMTLPLLCLPGPGQPRGD